MAEDDARRMLSPVEVVGETVMSEATPGSVQWAQITAQELAKRDASAISSAIMAAYNLGLDHARDACEREKARCETRDEEQRCDDISGDCLHMMFCDENNEPIGM